MTCGISSGRNFYEDIVYREIEVDDHILYTACVDVQIDHIEYNFLKTRIDNLRCDFNKEMHL